MILRRFFSFFLILLSFTIYSQNVDPNTVDLYYSTKINTSINLELISVDTDFDDNITYTIVSNPSNGTASLSGSTVTYTPSTNYLGTDTFTYKANDGTSDSAVKTVSVKVFKGYKTNFELLHTFKGEAAEDGYGRSIAMSDNNNVIAIGAFRNDGGGSNSGHVRVFSKTSGAWLQLGSDIDGESAGDYSGVSVDLSADGTILAVGAYLDDNDNGTNKGQVKVYKYQSGSWSQVGSTIEGQNYGDEQLGWEVALSADGNILAASAWKADYAGRTNNGVVRVYSWDGSSWSQIGSPLAETTSEDKYGADLSLSRDGKKIAIGVPGFDGDAGDDIGAVQTREWVTSEGAYSFNGSREVQGPTDSALNYNSFSNDGKTLAVGGYNYDSEKGITRVYQRDSNNQWVQLGSDLNGDSAGDHFALVSLSGDGKTLAVGADLNDSAATDAGQLKIYNYVNNQWSQIGTTILGDSSGDQLGSKTFVSRDGTLVLVSVVNDDTTNGDDSGSVRLYSLVNSTNSKPVATAQTVEANEKIAKTITLSGTDADGDTLTYSIVDSPSNGTVTLDGSSATYTSTSYTATSDSFTFKVNDGTVDSDAATVTINITDNSAPTMTISSSTVNDGDTSKDSSITVVFTSSEPTGDFNSEDVSVTGGSISDFNSTSSTIYTATFTPSSAGATTIDVPASTFTDNDGNNNTAASQFNWTYDDNYSGTNVSGVINSDITWTLGKSPYIITGNVLVDSGVTLTIEAGVTVKFNDNLYLKVEGTIKAVGTSSNKIVFESNNSSQNKSDWSGIRIRPSSSTSIDTNQNYSSGSQFKYVTIKHADIGLYVYDTGLHTSYTTFENNNKGFEIRKTDGVVIDNSTFTDNTIGIWSEYETFSPGIGISFNPVGIDAVPIEMPGMFAV